MLMKSWILHSLVKVWSGLFLQRGCLTTANPGKRWHENIGCLTALFFFPCLEASIFEPWLYI